MSDVVSDEYRAGLDSLIRELVAETGNNAAQVAREAGISETYLYEVRDGRRPSRTVARKLIETAKRLTDRYSNVEAELKRFGYSSRSDLNPHNFEPDQAGSWIAVLRELTELSAAEFAAQSGVSAETVIDAEAGKTQPQDETLRKFYRTFAARFMTEDDPHYFSEAELLDTFSPTGITDDDFEQVEHMGEVFDLSRRRLRISQEALSDASGIDIRTIRRIERGEISISSAQARALSSQLSGGYPREDSADDMLERFGFATLRSLNPVHYSWEEIESWLGDVRNFSGKSQESFAFENNKDQKSIARYEAGKQQPQSEFITLVYNRYLAPAMADLPEENRFTLDDVRAGLAYPGKREELLRIGIQQLGVISHHYESVPGITAIQASTIPPAVLRSIIRTAGTASMAEFHTSLDTTSDQFVRTGLGMEPGMALDPGEEQIYLKVQRIAHKLQQQLGEQPSPHQLANGVAEFRGELFPPEAPREPVGRGFGTWRAPELPAHQARREIRANSGALHRAGVGPDWSPGGAIPPVLRPPHTERGREGRRGRRRSS